jgi:uncharacterized iron-regulated membrane protein
MGHPRRHVIYRMRQIHRLMGLILCVPLFFVGVTGSILALKDPITASGILGSSDPWPQIYDFHRSLFAGWFGRILVSTMGLALLGMVLTGCRAFVRRKSRRMSTHAAMGLGFGVPIAIIAGLGSALNFVEPLSQWLDPIPAVLGTGDQQSAAQVLPVSELQLTKAKATADSANIPSDLIKIYHPKPDRPYLLFYYQGNTKLYIDPMDGKLLKVRSPSLHWTSALLPLHALHPLGGLGHGIMVFLGLILAMLTTLGIVSLGRTCARSVADLMTRFSAQSKRVRTLRG